MSGLIIVYADYLLIMNTHQRLRCISHRTIMIFVLKIWTEFWSSFFLLHVCVCLNRICVYSDSFLWILEIINGSNMVSGMWELFKNLVFTLVDRQWSLLFMNFSSCTLILLLIIFRSRAFFTFSPSLPHGNQAHKNFS